MIDQLEFSVKPIAFSLSSEEMNIDLRPDDQLQPLTVAVDEQAALVYLAGLGKGSQRTMWSALTVIAAVLSRGHCTPLDLPWHRLRRAHLIALRAWLIEHRAPATGRRLLAAAKGALKEAWRLGQMATDDYQRAIDIKPIRGVGKEQAAGRALTAGEKAAILAAMPATSAGIRDSAIVGLALYGGLRRAELSALATADYDPSTGQLTIRKGKGAKARTIYVAPGVDDALADWLAIRTGAPDDHGDNGKNDENPLFVHIRKGGHLTNTSISPEAIYALVQRAMERASVKKATPHDLRRTFAGDLLDAGADIATVQKLMGHSSASTTASYDRRGERAKQSAINRLHMPYQRKTP